MMNIHEIPLLEYDDTSKEIISPNHDWKGGPLPEKCLFAFLGEEIHKYAATNNAAVAGVLRSIFHDVTVYVIRQGNEEFCLVQAPLGAPVAVSVLDTLISCGCRKIIATGSCGVLTDIEENVFILPKKALRDEGTSYHYLPAERYIELDREPVAVIRKTFRKMNLPVLECSTWTTDGFFRETEEKVTRRLKEGCSVVEMECAALAACSRKRGAKFGQFLFTADSLANVHVYDARDFGRASREKALLLGLEILAEWSENDS